MRIANVLSVVALVAAALPAAAQSPAPRVKDWTVPWDRTRPRDPYPDARGRVWFVGQVGNYVAYLDTASGTFRRYEVEAGTNPHNLVVDARGQVWFTGNRNGRIVRLDPETGKLTTYMIPEAAVRDPHTMTFDRAGDAWFTAQQAGYVGRLRPSTGEFKLWKLDANSRPYGIVIDAKGRPWFDMFGTNRIGTIDPATLQLREYPLPDARARPRRIAVTSDGGVWYGDYTRGYVGRLDPASGKVEEWALPSGGASMPYAMTVDDQDRVWLVETGVQPNMLVAFDTKRREWGSSQAIPGASPNTVRHMVFDRRTRSIWYGSDANTIGRAEVGPRIVP